MSNKHAKKAYTRAIAEYVCETRFSDLPQEAVACAKLHLLDAIGIMLGAYGAKHELIRSLIELVTESCGDGQATIVGSGEKATYPDVVMTNSVMANFLDFSDGHFRGGHINDRLVPVTLAAAERVGASGKDLVTALVLGYEVYIDLASTLFGTVEPTSTRSPYFVILGALSGVVPAGKLFGLDVEQLAGALGLAASVQLTGAQYVVSGGHEKDLTVGHESRRAILSALIAEKGILGSRDILEGQRGVFNVLDAKPELPTGLGEHYRIVECYFKPYPACRFLHASIEATMNLKKEYDIPIAEIEKVTVRTNTSSSRRASYVISSHVHAIFSHPYQVATVLIDGHPSLPICWQEKTRHPLFDALLHRIEMVADPKYEAMFQRRSLEQPPWPAEVEVITRDGKSYRSEVLSPKGDPTNPLTPDEVRDKFSRLTEGVLTAARQAEILETVEHLEELADVADLVKLLVVS